MIEFESPTKLATHLYNFSKDVPYVMSQTLNDIAFNKQRELRQGGIEKYLDLKNTHTARGIRVEKANKANLTSSVHSIDWYLERQVIGESRSADGLFAPVTKSNTKYSGISLRTKTGKMKKKRVNAKRKPFVIERRNGVKQLFRRKTKKRLPLEYLATFYPQHNYDEKLDWENETKKNVNDYFTERYRERLIYGRNAKKT